MVFGPFVPEFHLGNRTGHFGGEALALEGSGPVLFFVCLSGPQPPLGEGQLFDVICTRTCCLAFNCGNVQLGELFQFGWIINRIVVTQDSLIPFEEPLQEFRFDSPDIRELVLPPEEVHLEVDVVKVHPVAYSAPEPTGFVDVIRVRILFQRPVDVTNNLFLDLIIFISVLGLLAENKILDHLGFVSHEPLDDRIFHFKLGPVLLSVLQLDLANAVSEEPAAHAELVDSAVVIPEELVNDVGAFVCGSDVAGEAVVIFAGLVFVFLTQVG